MTLLSASRTPRRHRRQPRTEPTARSLLAGRLARPDAGAASADLDARHRLRLQVQPPIRMPILAGERRDHRPAVAVLERLERHPPGSPLLRPRVVSSRISNPLTFVPMRPPLSRYSHRCTNHQNRGPGRVEPPPSADDYLLVQLTATHWPICAAAGTERPTQAASWLAVVVHQRANSATYWPIRT